MPWAFNTLRAYAAEVGRGAARDIVSRHSVQKQDALPSRPRRKYLPLLCRVIRPAASCGDVLSRGPSRHYAHAWRRGMEAGVEAGVDAFRIWEYISNMDTQLQQ